MAAGTSLVKEGVAFSKSTISFKTFSNVHSGIYNIDCIVLASALTSKAYFLPSHLAAGL